MPEGRIMNRIRYLRFINGEMTQEQLAEKAGCTRQTIIALEQRKYHPSLLLAFRIARALGQGIEDVFQYEEQGG
ncbi:MAG TPA: transcriptional regulator [Clostridiales bacterium]|nr:transcriptional regulator [Clostridiales bacterium]